MSSNPTKQSSVKSGSVTRWVKQTNDATLVTPPSDKTRAYELIAPAYSPITPVSTDTSTLSAPAKVLKSMPPKTKKATVQASGTTTQRKQPIATTENKSSPDTNMPQRSPVIFIDDIEEKRSVSAQSLRQEADPDHTNVMPPVRYNHFVHGAVKQTNEAPYRAPGSSQPVQMPLNGPSAKRARLSLSPDPCSSQATRYAASIAAAGNPQQSIPGAPIQVVPIPTGAALGAPAPHPGRPLQAQPTSTQALSEPTLNLLKKCLEQQSQLLEQQTKLAEQQNLLSRRVEFFCDKYASQKSEREFRDHDNGRRLHLLENRNAYLEQVVGEIVRTAQRGGSGGAGNGGENGGSGGAGMSGHGSNGVNGNGTGHQVNGGGINGHTSDS